MLAQLVQTSFGDAQNGQGVIAEEQYPSIDIL
jgi:hypothetical protein